MTLVNRIIQVSGDSTTHFLYTVLCVRQPKTSLCPSSFITLYPPLPLPHHAPGNDHTLVFMSMIFFSFFLFCSISPPLLHLAPIPDTLSLLSVSLSLFCLLVHFVNYIPHMREIMWYLSFSDWLISFSLF